MHKLTVFTKDNCIQCKMTKRFLEARNIDFEEKNINQNPEYIDYLKSQGFAAVPIIEGENIETIAGFQPDALQQLA